MSSNPPIDRRSVLYGAAFAVGGVALGACSRPDGGDAGESESESGSGTPSKGQGSEADPLPSPGRFSEAPMLTEQVETGELPPVDERLPTNPYVIPHRWMTVGKYGGELQLVMNSTDDWSLHEYQYGHSPLRWLNDGLDIGPGLAESWESNDDLSEWILHFREGLKWSDGEPFSTADVMFWWEDLVQNEEFPAGVPDAARSGTGTLAEFSAPDDVTLVLTFDAPAPMVPEIIANWVNGMIDAGWVHPRHYLEQFHATYNPNVPNSWAEELDSKRDPKLNPEVPVLTGWRPESREEGSSITWVRNPYYYAVDVDGNQLPYVDRVKFRAVDNIENRKLQIFNGQYDFVHGPFHDLGLSDVAAIRELEEEHGFELIFWDSGSGTGSIFFFNQDYHEPAMRALIREPKFRQALSLAYDRAEVLRSIYFEQGELTTGAYGPKTREFTRGDGEQMYADWRDSWVEYDPDRAMQLLDELGVVDKDGDGKRELPDGGRLRIPLVYPGDIDPNGQHMKKNNLLRDDWTAIGLDVELEPISPTALEDEWAAGRMMTRTDWEASTVNVASDLIWIIPMETSRWAPLQGQFYAIRGTPAAKDQLDVDPYERTPPRMEAEPDGPIDRLWKLSDQVRLETDPVTRDALVWDMIKIHVEDGPFFMGCVANYPQLELVRNGLRNVPQREETMLGGLVNDWHHPTPAAYDPEAWYWEDPDEHAG